jgi:hypothetical protein
MKDGKDAEISPTKKMMQVGRKPSMAMGGEKSSLQIHLPDPACHSNSF